MFRNIFQRNQPATPAIRNITPAELQAKIAARESLVLIDVRSPEEYAQDGHIAGSRLMPLPMLATRLNEIPKHTPVICICRSGNRSRAACEVLAQHGFEVTNMSGGMMAWRQAGLPTKFK
ncbi:MAG: rhodanese-like domain-containing protein [Roseiflexaceae bacterium]